MLSVKLGGIEYHFLSLWYDSTEDWTPVSRTIGKHPTHKPMLQYELVELNRINRVR